MAPHRLHRSIIPDRSPDEKELGISVELQYGFHHKKAIDRNLTPYTEAVICEIQRLGNIAPTSIFHRTLSEVKLSNYKIPPDTLIIPMIGDIMHDPEYFHEPLKFNPDRYLIQDENGKLKFQSDPRVIPFGTGKRRCLGEQLARTTIYKFFTAIVQKYEIISGQDEPIEDKYTPGFTRMPKTFKLIFKPRKHKVV